MSLIFITFLVLKFFGGFAEVKKIIMFTQAEAFAAFTAKNWQHRDEPVSSGQYSL